MAKRKRVDERKLAEALHKVLKKFYPDAGDFAWAEVAEDITESTVEMMRLEE